jgi:hypothetical protein
MDALKSLQAIISESSAYSFGVKMVGAFLAIVFLLLLQDAYQSFTYRKMQKKYQSFMR